MAPRAGASREPWPEAEDGAQGGSQAPRRPPRATRLIRPAPTSRPPGLGAQGSRVLADLAPAASERGGASPQTVGGSGGLSWPRGCPRTPRASLGVTGGGDSDFGKVTGFLASGNHFQFFPDLCQLSNAPALPEVRIWRVGLHFVFCGLLWHSDSLSTGLSPWFRDHTLLGLISLACLTRI